MVNGIVGKLLMRIADEEAHKQGAESRKCERKYLIEKLEFALEDEDDPDELSDFGFALIDMADKFTRKSMHIRYGEVDKSDV